METEEDTTRRRGHRAGPRIALLLLLTLACAREDPEEQRPSPAGVPVETVSVEAEDVRQTLPGIGTLRAAETVEIRPEVAATVQKVHFEGGARVEEGQELYTLEDQELQHRRSAAESALEAARLRRNQAKRTVERLSGLAEQDLVAEEEYDQAQTDLARARAEVERLTAELQRIREMIAETHIAAPLTGTISESRVDPGDFVDTGESLATIYDTSVLEMEFSLPERAAGQVRPGQSVSVRVGAQPGRSLPAEVTYVSPSVRETTRDVLVKARLLEGSEELLPGTFGQAVVSLGQGKKRPVVPEEALVALRDGYAVFVVEDGQARLQRVEVGQREPGRVELTSGVTPGQVVVRQGHMGLSDGDRVKITNPSGGGTSR